MCTVIYDENPSEMRCHAIKKNTNKFLLLINAALINLINEKIILKTKILKFPLNCLNIILISVLKTFLIRGSGNKLEQCQELGSKCLAVLTTEVVKVLSISIYLYQFNLFFF